MTAMTENKATMLRNLGLILSVSLLLLNSIAEGKQAVQNCKTNYEVQSGDTCYGIWQKFNLTQEVFYDINPNVVCDKLIVGQPLCIDRLATGSKNTKCKTNYKIQSGDTCYSICMKFNLTQEEFYHINPNIVCEKLIVGQFLCIDDGKAPTLPAKPPTPAPQRSPIPGPEKLKCKGVYEVQKGDTCNAIWQKFNLTQKKFKENNPGVVCDLLYIGQKICIGEKM